MKSTWRLLVCLAALLAVGVTVAACGSDDDDSSSSSSSGGGGEVQTVKLGSPAPLTHALYPIFTGDMLGYFEEEGLKVEIVTGGTQVSMPGLLESDKVDIVMMSGPEAMFGIAEGGDVSVLSDPWTRTAEGIITIDDEVQSLEDLKGKTIGLSEDEDRAFVSTALSEVGMSIDDVETVVIGQEPATAANVLTKGEIDAYASPFDTFAILDARGLNTRDLTPKTLLATPSVSFATKSSTVESDPDMVEGFLRAYAKGVWAGQAAPEAVRAMYKVAVPDDWKEDPEVISATLDQIYSKFAPVDENKIGELFADKWQAAEEQLIKAGELEEPVNITDHFDDRFLIPSNDWDRAEVKADAEAWQQENAGK